MKTSVVSLCVFLITASPFAYSRDPVATPGFVIPEECALKAQLDRMKCLAAIKADEPDYLKKKSRCEGIYYNEMRLCGQNEGYSGPDSITRIPTNSVPAFTDPISGSPGTRIPAPSDASSLDRACLGVMSEQLFCDAPRVLSCLGTLTTTGTPPRTSSVLNCYCFCTRNPLDRTPVDSDELTPRGGLSID